MIKATYVAPLNVLSFLILLLNKVINTSTIVAGYITVKIGDANFIIALTPKFATTALNIQTTTTIVSYFTFPLDIFVKYWAVAETRPIDVVKQANPTIIANTILPGWPNNCSVIPTIKAVWFISDGFIPLNWCATVDPKYVNPPYTINKAIPAIIPAWSVIFTFCDSFVYPFCVIEIITTADKAIAP